MSMIQPATTLPDHGCGGLGRVTHGALTSSLSDAHDGPGLYLGYNTLPDPPFPLTAYLSYDLGPQAAALDPETLLRMGADSIRAQPVPDEPWDEAHQRLAATMRVDAVVLTAVAHAMEPGSSQAARALLANLAEGYYREGDAETCVDARETAVALGVDRAGTRVVLVADGDAASTRVEAEAKGVLFDLLGEVLDAQYSWTRAAFAL
ncbi:hypothetical protein [Nonomuraea diastatica]|uniref:Uncharacterized protein n=1 Tax=Nonomuraea diastatica TaxID=1848329 RepID=A0A4V2YCG8_9ACTN|nr:hypothetical protein [Nonomuraea diastatica]TDD11446.1 hypothetical protein E1294_45150 [Nonomuraea diastatica]